MAGDCNAANAVGATSNNWVFSDVQAARNFVVMNPFVVDPPAAKCWHLPKRSRAHGAAVGLAVL